MKKFWGFFCFFGAFCLVTATAVSAQFLLPEDFNHRLGVYQLDTALGGSKTEVEGGIAILGVDADGAVVIDLRVWGKGSAEPTCRFYGSGYDFDINKADSRWSDQIQQFTSAEFENEFINFSLMMRMQELMRTKLTLKFRLFNSRSLAIVITMV